MLGFLKKVYFVPSKSLPFGSEPRPLPVSQLGLFIFTAALSLALCSLIFASASQADLSSGGEAIASCPTCLGMARTTMQGATQPLAGNASLGAGGTAFTGWGPNVAAFVGRVQGAGPMRSLLEFPGELPALPPGPQPVYQGMGMIPGSFAGTLIPTVSGFAIGNWETLAPPAVVGSPFLRPSL